MPALVSWEVTTIWRCNISQQNTKENFLLDPEQWDFKNHEWCHFDHIHLLLSFYDINIKYDYFCGMACNGKSFIFGLNSQGVCIYFFLPVVQQLCISLKLQSNYKNNTSCKKWKSHKEIWQRTGNQIRCIWDGNVQLLGFFFSASFLFV